MITTKAEMEQYEQDEARSLTLEYLIDNMGEEKEAE